MIQCDWIIHEVSRGQKVMESTDPWYIKMDPVAVIARKGNKRQIFTSVSDYSKCTICQTTTDDQGYLYIT
ncbi:hypothetical protein SK128_027263 [Halocaridina rubra]|uniref:Uncharacterized protein n=1 Tax=Halocaridina rubra TaxID=373956 RepID=A0AAN8XFT8_HALRR